MTLPDFEHRAIVGTQRFKPVEVPDVDSIVGMYPVSPAGHDENGQIFRPDNTSPFLPQERALGKLVNNSSRQGGWAQGAMDNMMNGINSLPDGYMRSGSASMFADERVDPPFEFCCITPTASLFMGMTPTPMLEQRTPPQDARTTPAQLRSPPQAGDVPPPRLRGGPSASSSIGISSHSAVEGGNYPLPAGHHQISRPGAMRDIGVSSRPPAPKEERGQQELGVGKRRRIPVARDLPHWSTTKDEERNGPVAPSPRVKPRPASEVITSLAKAGGEGRGEGARVVAASVKKREGDGRNAGATVYATLKAGKVDDAARAKALKQREEITAMLYKKDSGGSSSSDNRKGGKYKGVTWDRAKRMWRVRVCLVGGSRQHIGYYADEEAGAEAYLDALKQLGL